MNKALAIFALVIAVVTSSQAALITSNQTSTVTTDGVNFTFSQFNPSTGNLTAIDLIIQSSTLQGNLTYTKGTGSTYTISNLNAALAISGPGLGVEGYSTSDFTYARTPSGSFTLNATNATRLITVNGTTQSLIGGSPITLSIASSDFGSYLGSSNVDFNVLLNFSDTTIKAGSATMPGIDSTNFLSPTTLALLYTYTVPTPPSPVPEPSQVAASLLVIGGLGIYLLRRRQISTKSA